MKLREHLCRAWRHTWEFKHLKIYKKGEEKDVFDVSVNDPLDDTIDGAPESTPEGAPKDALTDLHRRCTRKYILVCTWIATVVELVGGLINTQKGKN